jgi:hypothetical protein
MSGCCPSLKTSLPRFVSVIAVLLGVYDLLRGFMHTILLKYSALHIAGLDLSTATASDQLRLLGAFGIGNYETGIMLILMGLFARPLAFIMLGVTPALYFIGFLSIRHHLEGLPPSAAQWGGMEPMVVYLGIALTTFLLGLLSLIRQRALREA